MSAVRHATSTRLTRLAAKASPYNSAVTLYQLHTTETSAGSPKDAAQAEPSTPRRRSRRVKREPSDADESFPDVPVALQPPAARTAKSTKETLKGEDGLELKSADNATSSAQCSPRKKPASKSKAIARPLDVPLAAPSRWADVYAAIEDMRSRVVAPVDTMGCDMAQFKERDPKNQRFATLVSLMLSSQTKDEVTDAAVSKLQSALGGTLSVQAMLDAEDATVSEAIAKVGFWRKKTQYIKQAAQRLRDEFDDDVPKTVEELCSLPGVGPKMAFLTLQVAWRLNVGIGVDVHVHRITNRLGWHARPTRTPEETRVNLESWLPKELHGEINHLLVGFGQTVCLPIGPKCGECTLSADGLCPSARAGSTGIKAKANFKIMPETETEAAISSPSKSRRKHKSKPESESEVENLVEEGSGPKIKIEMEEMSRDSDAEDVGPPSCG